MEQIKVTFEQVQYVTAVLQILVSVLIGISVSIGLRNRQESFRQIAVISTVSAGLTCAWLAYSIFSVARNGLSMEQLLGQSLVFGIGLGVSIGFIPFVFGLLRRQYGLAVLAIVASVISGVVLSILPFFAVAIFLRKISGKSESVQA